MLQSAIFALVNKAIYLPLGQPLVDNSKTAYENMVDFSRDMVLGSVVFGVLPVVHGVLNSSTANLLSQMPKGAAQRTLGFVMPVMGEAAFFRYMGNMESFVFGELLPPGYGESHESNQEAWLHALGMTLAFKVGFKHSKIKQHNDMIQNELM